MKYQQIDEDYIQIMPENIPIESVLEEIARQSFKTALVRTPFQTGSDFPSDQNVEGHDFSKYLIYQPIYEIQTFDEPRGSILAFLGPKKIKKRVEISKELTGMRMDYPDGRQCKTWIIKKNDRWLLKVREYSASETLDQEGRIVQRDPKKLLHEVSLHYQKK